MKSYREQILVLVALTVTLQSALGWADMIEKTMVVEQRYELILNDGEDPGNEADIYDCLYTAMPPQMEVDSPSDVLLRYRLLCGGPDVTFAAHLKMLGNLESTLLVVDIASSEWLQIMDSPDGEPRGNDESYEQWAIRMGDPRDHNFAVETDVRIFDRFDAEVSDQAVASNWPQLQVANPGISGLIEWLSTHFSTGVTWPPIITVVRQMDQFVYGGKTRTETVNQCNKISAQHRPHDEPSDPEFEKRFGKWSAFPDMPGLK